MRSWGNLSCLTSLILFLIFVHERLNLELSIKPVGRWKSLALTSESNWLRNLTMMGSGLKNDEGLSVNFEDFMNPNLTESNLFIMIVSSRHNFEARQAIRETWAKNLLNYRFLIGKNYCIEKFAKDISLPEIQPSRIPALRKIQEAQGFKRPRNSRSPGIRLVSS